MYKQLQRITVIVLITLLLSGVPVPAATSTAHQQNLPPLPEWPILGPILKRLGVGEAEAPPPPEPDPDLPEYRIETFEDIDALEDIEPQERVRLIATDTDLNRMIAERLAQNAQDEAEVTLDFDLHQVTVNVRADEGLLEQTGAELPRQVRGDLDMTATLNVIGGSCRVYVEFKKIRVNRWSFGLRPVAERAINSRIPEIWPNDLCVERVLFWDGEAAVEGYYR